MNNVVVVLAGLLPTYVIRFSIAGIPTTLFEVLVWASVVGSVAMPRTRTRLWRAALAIPKKTLLWSTLFLLAAIISTAISPVPRSSFGILKGWVVTPMVFGFLVFAAAYTDSSVRKRVIRSLLLSGLIVALFGLSQIQGVNRITSMYDVPNSLALFLVPIAVLGAWIGVRERNRLYLLITLPLILAIIYTQSLVAVISLGATLMIGWIMWPNRTENKRIRVIVFAGTLILVSILFAMSGRFSYLASPLTNPGTHNSVTVRLQLWGIGLRLIREHLLLGIGLGQFEPAYQKQLHERFAQQDNKKPIPEFVFRDPHNWIISFWLNLGVLGLIVFACLNYQAIQGWKNAIGTRHQVLILSLIAMLLFGLADTVYWKNDLSALWWLLILLRQENPR